MSSIEPPTSRGARTRPTSAFGIWGMGDSWRSCYLSFPGLHALSMSHSTRKTGFIPTVLLTANPTFSPPHRSQVPGHPIVVAASYPRFSGHGGDTFLWTIVANGLLVVQGESVGFQQSISGFSLVTVGLSPRSYGRAGRNIED